MSRHDRAGERARGRRATSPPPRRSGTPRPAAPAAPAASPARAWLGVLAAALVVAVLLVWRPWRAPAPPAPAAATAVERLDLRAAYTEAVRLYQSRRDLESLPYFRRALALVPQPSRTLHLQITDALERATLQVRGGAAQPATRSSVERIALVREALAHLDEAERLSGTPRERAEVRAWRANILRVWGFPWETLLGLRSASEADPGWRVVAESADLYAHRLHHPEDVIPGIDSDVSLPGAP